MFPTVTQRITRRAACLCAIALGACSAASSDTVHVERTDSAGVEVVLSRGPDRALDWTFEPVQVVGDTDEGPASFGGLFEDGIAIDPEHNLVVLDATNRQVVVFDRDGRHVRTMGRKGGGPGELQWPSALAVAEDGTVGVYDFSKRGLVRYGADGSVLPHQPLPTLEGLRLETTGGRTWGVFAERRDFESPVTLRLLGIAQADTIELARHGRASAGMVRFPNCAVAVDMAPVLAPVIAWAAHGPRVAWTSGPSYSINISENGRVTRVLRRDVPPEPLTDALAEEEVGDSMRIRFGGGECAIPPRDVVAARGKADVIPAVRDVVLAPGGHVLVGRGVGKRAHWRVDVFDPQGAYVGTLAAGTPFATAFRGADEVVALERDDLDRPRVVFYRVSGL